MRSGYPVRSGASILLVAFACLCIGLVGLRHLEGNLFYGISGFRVIDDFDGNTPLTFDLESLTVRVYFPGLTSELAYREALVTLNLSIGAVAVVAVQGHRVLLEFLALCVGRGDLGFLDHHDGLVLAVMGNVAAGLAKEQQVAKDGNDCQANDDTNDIERLGLLFLCGCIRRRSRGAPRRAWRPDCSVLVGRHARLESKALHRTTRRL